MAMMNSLTPSIRKDSNAIERVNCQPSWSITCCAVSCLVLWITTVRISCGICIWHRSSSPVNSWKDESVRHSWMDTPVGVSGLSRRSDLSILMCKPVESNEHWERVPMSKDLWSCWSQYSYLFVLHCISLWYQAEHFPTSSLKWAVPIVLFTEGFNLAFVYINNLLLSNNTYPSGTNTSR